MAEEFLPVRLSHCCAHCSVGAIVRGEDSLVVVHDIRDWYRKGQDPREYEIRYVEQVKSALGISQALCRPPVKRERDGNITGWIRAQRFPLWMRCLQCGLMHRAPWRRGAKLTNCAVQPVAGELEQVPWVLAHESGYLADAPWHALAHAASAASRGASVPGGFARALPEVGRWRFRSSDQLHAVSRDGRPGVEMAFRFEDLATAVDPRTACRSAQGTGLATGDQRCPCPLRRKSNGASHPPRVAHSTWHRGGSTLRATRRISNA